MAIQIPMNTNTFQKYAYGMFICMYFITNFLFMLGRMPMLGDPNNYAYLNLRDWCAYQVSNQCIWVNAFYGMEYKQTERILSLGEYKCDKTIFNSIWDKAFD